MTDDERRFLALIAANPGIAAIDLPRCKRGATLKGLELAGRIHYGPGGWYAVPEPVRNTVALCSGCGVPAHPSETDDLDRCLLCREVAP